jgi:hypothetical protein
MVGGGREIFHVTINSCFYLLLFVRFIFIYLFSFIFIYFHLFFFLFFLFNYHQHRPRYSLKWIKKEGKIYPFLIPSLEMVTHWSQTDTNDTTDTIDSDNDTD